MCFFSTNYILESLQGGPATLPQELGMEHIQVKHTRLTLWGIAEELTIPVTPEATLSKKGKLH